MVGEGSISIFITFLLAMLGYLGLTIAVIFSVKQRIPFLFWKIIVLIILSHVFMVWIFRFNMQFSLAVRNGYGGFIIFHSALLLIIISLFTRTGITEKLIHFSFIIVTIGALGAVFEYEVVRNYRIPVIILSIIGTSNLIWFYLKKQKIKTEQVKNPLTPT